MSVSKVVCQMTNYSRLSHEIAIFYFTKKIAVKKAGFASLLIANTVKSAHTHTQTHTQMHMHTCMHTHTHTHSHTHTHTHLFTCCAKALLVCSTSFCSSSRFLCWDSSSRGNEFTCTSSTAEYNLSHDDQCHIQDTSL